VALTRMRPVVGVNSILPDEQHFLMWDFDAKSLQQVTTALECQSAIWKLPPIHLVRSSSETNYHAYCFDAVSFERAAAIIGGTPCVDRMYQALALVRKYWTLRITDYPSAPFQPIGIIKGYRSPTVDHHKLDARLVQYLTAHSE